MHANLHVNDGDVGLDARRDLGGCELAASLDVHHLKSHKSQREARRRGRSLLATHLKLLPRIVPLDTSTKLVQRALGDGHLTNKLGLRLYLGH